MRLSLSRISPDRRVNDALTRRRTAFQQGQIAFCHATVLKLTHQVASGTVLQGEQDESAGVLVESVYDAGAFWLAGHVGQRGPAGKGGRDERSALVVVTRVHDHAGRFVNDGEALVFVDDLQGDGFWHNAGRIIRARQVQHNAFAAPQTFARLALLAVHLHGAIPDEGLQLRARQTVSQVMENGQIETPAGFVQDELETLRFHVEAFSLLRKAAAFAT